MWRYLTGCILIVIGAYFYMIFPGMERKREIWKFRGTQWAHRGLHDKKSGIPENSMAAFREAIRVNKGIELDVHLTKDKKIAVFHDDSLKRMCKVSGTQAEPTMLDSGFLSFHSPFPLPFFQLFQLFYRFLYQRMSRIIRNVGQKLLSPLTGCQRIICVVIKRIICVVQGKFQRWTHLRRAAAKSQVMPKRFF